MKLVWRGPGRTEEDDTRFYTGWDPEDIKKMSQEEYSWDVFYPKRVRFVDFLGTREYSFEECSIIYGDGDYEIYDPNPNEEYWIPHHPIYER